MENLKLSELKAKSPAELLTFAEEYEVENASTMRKQELMFAILKELAAHDIEITGEAFSAFGMRKGNLISCRSRLELKAQERHTGKILLIDRQTSVAVDIAEQIAAKTALHNVADELAERLLPKLTE